MHQRPASAAPLAAAPPNPPHAPAIAAPPIRARARPPPRRRLRRAAVGGFDSAAAAVSNVIRATAPRPEWIRLRVEGGAAAWCDAARVWAAPRAARLAARRRRARARPPARGPRRAAPRNGRERDGVCARLAVQLRRRQVGLAQRAAVTEQGGGAFLVRGGAAARHRARGCTRGWLPTAPSADGMQRRVAAPPPSAARPMSSRVPPAR